MVAKRVDKKDEKRPARRPAKTSLGRELQLISLAHDLAEKRLKDGTASAQEITHWLKAGSSREILEQNRLRAENDLLDARVSNIRQQESSVELYQNAIDAMRSYSGNAPEEEYYDD